MSRSPVLVTGGAGFIGSHLVEQLVAFNAQVTVIDSLVTGHRSNLAGVLDCVDLITDDLGDLLRSKQLDLSHYAYIFHLAANPYIPPSVENPAYDFQNNLEMTFSLVEALRQIDRLSAVPRLVNISSAAVYGNPSTLPIYETDPTVPISPYGVSKLAAESYVRVFSQLYNKPAASVRLFSVFGPRQRKQVAFDLLLKLRADATRLEVLGDGTQVRDFVYVQDVVQALILVATQAPGNGEVYNVATGTSHSIATMVKAWTQVLGIQPKITYTGQLRPGDAQRWEVDITRLKQLGFSPRTTLHQGLAAIHEWYESDKAA